MTAFREGDRVRVKPNHWARANQEGTLVRWYQPSSRWLVRFDLPGIGVTDPDLWGTEGDYQEERYFLFLDEASFDRLDAIDDELSGLEENGPDPIEAGKARGPQA